MQNISDPAAAVSLLKRGLTLLSLCCGSYILFWLNGYQPEKAFRRAQPLSILLFVLTLALGVSGLFCIISGMNQFEPKQTPIKGSFIVIGAIALYALSAFITVHFFNRPITTELLLITLWAALMVEILNVSAAQSLLDHTAMIVSVLLVAVVYFISMILYVVYYQMEPWPAYYAAVIPLLAIGIDCALTSFAL